jgi:DNA-binding transcriptional LysR family regulator
MELLFAQGHARAVLPAAADLKSMTQRVGKKRRALAIGFEASTLYDFLPELVRRLRARCQIVEITSMR